MKHTKGEWYVFNRHGILNDNESPGIECKPKVGDAISIIIFDYTYNELPPTEVLANAKLIAAAPDLLEALKVCYESLCTYGSHPIIDKQVQGAIEKATA